MSQHRASTDYYRVSVYAADLDDGPTGAEVLADPAVTEVTISGGPWLRWPWSGDAQTALVPNPANPGDPADRVPGAVRFARRLIAGPDAGVPEPTTDGDPVPLASGEHYTAMRLTSPLTLERPVVDGDMIVVD